MTLKSERGEAAAQRSIRQSRVVRTTAGRTSANHEPGFLTPNAPSEPSEHLEEEEALAESLVSSDDDEDWRTHHLQTESPQAPDRFATSEEQWPGIRKHSRWLSSREAAVAAEQSAATAFLSCWVCQCGRVRYILFPRTAPNI